MPRKPPPGTVVPELKDIKGLPPALRADPKMKVIPLGKQMRIGKYGKTVDGRNHLDLNGYVVDGRYYSIETYKKKFDRFGNPRPEMVETGPARHRVRKIDPAPANDAAAEETPKPEPPRALTASGKRRGRPPHPVKGAVPEAGVSYQFKPRSDGRYTVLKIWSAYDPGLKNNSAYKTQTLGITSIPYDITHLEPTARMQKKQMAATLEQLRSAARPPQPKPSDDATQKTPPKCVERKYPFSIVVLVAIAAMVGGARTCQNIASFWAEHRPYWEKIFPDFPKDDISHDTVRRIIERVGIENGKELLKNFLCMNIKDRIAAINAQVRNLHLDGQMIRASTNEGGRAPDVLNVYDSTLGIVLSHELVGAKTNEIPHSLSVIKGLDLANCIVTCDALNTQKDFAQAIRAAGGDYCFAVKGNHSAEETDIRATFNREPADSTDLKTYIGDFELAHGRIERRSIRVLPARRMSSNLRKLWPGLEDGRGCIVEATTYSERKLNGERDESNLDESGPPDEDKKAGRRRKKREPTIKRYFISTLEYQADDIAMIHAHLVRGHWAIETAHWGWDVVFAQDKLHCKSGLVTMGFTTLIKISDFFVREICELKRRQGCPAQELTRPEQRYQMGNPANSFPLICRIADQHIVSERSQATGL